MRKRLLNISLLFLFIMINLFSIDLKFIKKPMFSMKDIPFVTAGYFEWISENEIFYSGNPYAVILNIENNQVERIFDHGKKDISVWIAFQNEDIILFNRYDYTKNVSDYIIRKKQTGKMYYLNKDDKDDYLADGGEDYTYYGFQDVYIKETRQPQLIYYKSTVLSNAKERIWVVNPDDEFGRRLSVIFPQDSVGNHWLVTCREQLYIMDIDNNGITNITSFTDETGETGVFLKDGRVIKAYVDWENDRGLELGEAYYYRLGIFNKKGEFEEEIGKDIYASGVGARRISINHDRTKLLLIGYDGEHLGQFLPEPYIYEIIYD